MTYSIFDDSTNSEIGSYETLDAALARVRFALRGKNNVRDQWTLASPGFSLAGQDLLDWANDPDATEPRAEHFTDEIDDLEWLDIDA